MCFTRAFITCQINYLNLRCSYRVTARLSVSIINLHIDTKYSVRARALLVTLRLGYDAHLLTKLEKLLDILCRSDIFEGEVFDYDLALVIPDV